MSSVKKMLDLSTGNMPGPSPTFGGLRHVEHEYGYIVFVCPTVFTNIPDWLREIHAAAVKEGAILINFDRDAKPCLDFYVYEW